MNTINEKITHYGPEALTTKEVIPAFLGGHSDPESK